MSLQLEQVTGVRMLNNPPIDKVAALVLLERHTGHEIQIVGFEDRINIPKPEWNEWLRAGIVPIDLGETKYHGKAGSASEFAARAFNLPLEESEEYLVRLLNENNRTGSLKSYFCSVAWLMRDLYEVDRDPREVIERVKRVIRIHLTPEPEIDLFPPKDVWERFPQFAELRPDNSGKPGPLTVGRHLEKLNALHQPDEEIVAEGNWWLAGYRQVREAQAEGERQLGDPSRLREFNLGGLKCAALNSDNKFATRAATKNYNVVVVVCSTGHATIMAVGYDLGALADHLARIEPSVPWKHQPGMLINGGLVYKGASPTAFNARELEELLRQFPPQKLQGRGKKR